mmetsp:Transcript_59960/g.104913  ORF Transcript_59960/g.104913 Transcript_59960/m.104913 type:complete len:413 (+) Transcript_59960:41-1279(+)
MARSLVASSPLLRRAVSETRLATLRRHGARVVGLSGSSKWPSQAGCRQNLHSRKHDDAADNLSDNATLSILLQELCGSAENEDGNRTPLSDHNEPGSPLQFGRLRADLGCPMQRQSSETYLLPIARKKAASSNSLANNLAVSRSSEQSSRGAKACTLPNLAYSKSRKASDAALELRLHAALQAPVPRQGRPIRKVLGDTDVQEKTEEFRVSRALAQLQARESKACDSLKCLERAGCKEATVEHRQPKSKCNLHKQPLDQADAHLECPKQNFSYEQTIALDPTVADQILLEGLLQNRGLRGSRCQQIAGYAEDDCQRAVSREQMPTVQLLASELLSDRVPSRGVEHQQAWQSNRVPSRGTKGNFFVDLSTHLEEYDEGALDTGLFFSRLGTGTVRAGSEGFVVVNRNKHDDLA